VFLVTSEVKRSSPACFIVVDEDSPVERPKPVLPVVFVAFVVRTGSGDNDERNTPGTLVPDGEAGIED
jgi:hypothetical protein